MDDSFLPVGLCPSLRSVAAGSLPFLPLLRNHLRNVMTPVGWKDVDYGG